MPDPGNPQSLNRFAYALGNPLKFIDPTGHAQVCADGDEGGGCGQGMTTHWADLLLNNQSQLDGEILAWLQDTQNLAVVEAMGRALWEKYGQTAAGIPESYAQIYSMAFRGGDLPELWHDAGAQHLATVIDAGLASGGAIVGGAGARKELARPGGAGVYRYAVGKFSALNARSVKGDGLQIHHASQAHPAAQVIPGYDRTTAPAIVLSDAEHLAVNKANITGAYSGTPRQLMAKTLWDLRIYTDAPNSALQQLLELNRATYPGAFAK